MFVYLIHFDEPLSHAKHYVGSTEHVRERLTNHANGRGSRILRYLHAQRLHWTLARMLVCNRGQARYIERRLKDQKNSPEFCPICNPNGQRQIPGARDYPIDCITWTPNSKALRTDTQKPPAAIEPATMTDAKWIAAIQTHHKVELGFIPHGGIQEAIQKDHCITIKEGEQRAGFIIYTHNRNADGNETVKIHQCAIEDRFRLLGYGAHLVAAVRGRHPDALATCKVRHDLPANDFWTSIGWKQTGEIIHPTSKQKLIHYTGE